jgi:hypothetical protein
MKNPKPIKPNVETAEDRVISEAIERVYRKYGSDLNAFLRDIDDELIIKRQEAPRRQNQTR